MKNSWQTKKLGDVLKLEYGKPLPKSDRKDDGLYPVYGANGIKAFSNKFHFHKPSIIVGRKGSAGELNLVKQKFWPLDVTYFVTFDEKKYDLKFLYNLLITLDLPKLAKGVKPGINRNDVYSIEVNIPPLLEQHRIVKVLDEVFERIAKVKENSEKNLQNAKELFESYLQGIFANPGKDWEEKKLGEVCGFFNGFAFKSSDSVKISNTQLIRMGNLYQNHLDLGRRSVYYPDDFAIKYNKYLLREDDLIISLTGTTGKEDYGYTVKIPKTNKTLLLNQRIAKIVILNESETIKSYLLHFLLSRTFLNKLYKTAHGTRQANLSTDTIKNIPLMIPGAIDQLAIVTKLNTLSAETKKLEVIYKQKLADLEELKKSILQKAFSGEL